MEKRSETVIVISDIGQAERWCTKNIGPKCYHLHVGIGGRGWHIYPQHCKLIVNDEYLGLLAMLTLNGKN